MTRGRKKKLAIWGSGGHAKVVTDIVKLVDDYEIVGQIIDEGLEKKQGLHQKLPVFIGINSLEDIYRMGVRFFLLAFGDCHARVEKAAIVHAKGFQLAKAIHPSAVVATDAVVGSGTVIVAGTVVNPGSHIGQNVIINTGSSVDHDCSISDGVHIGPGVHLAGHVHVGACTFIGVGSVVTDKVTIGRRVVIGAGSTVLQDIPDDVVAFGSPAKVVRKLDAY